LQTNVTYNEDGHPIRDITNTFNNNVDNGSCKSFILLSLTPQASSIAFVCKDNQTDPCASSKGGPPICVQISNCSY
jgi:hypothetical protein